MEGERQSEIQRKNRAKDDAKDKGEIGIMRVQSDVYYARDERCKMDIYAPDDGYKTAIVYFHGGGLTNGSRKDGEGFAKSLCDKGYLVALVDYRMFPEAREDDYLRDGAMATAFIRDYTQGAKIFVTGQSAGAYIAVMLAVNPRWLNEQGMDGSEVSGWFIDSAQMTTHFQVLTERGMDGGLERIDSAAPLYYVGKDLFFSRMYLLSYTHDIMGRLEQNKLFYRTVLKFNPSAQIGMQVLEGGHCAAGAYQNGDYLLVTLLVDFIKEKLF